MNKPKQLKERTENELINKYKEFKTESYRKRIYKFGYDTAKQEIQKQVFDKIDEIERIATTGNAINILDLLKRYLKEVFEK